MAKILVVDDSEDLRDIFLLILKKKGHDVILARSIDEAKDQLDMYFPDIMLLDIKIGGSDGRPFCKLIKSKREHKFIKIILVSAAPELLKTYKEYNADDIIEKPFDIDTITSMVNKMIKELVVAK